MKKTLNSMAQSLKGFRFTNTLGVVAVIAVLSVLVQFQSKDFFSLDNFITLARNCSITILVGYGQMVVMAGGGMNVSLGSVGGVAEVIVGALIKRADMP